MYEAVFIHAFSKRLRVVTVISDKTAAGGDPYIALTVLEQRFHIVRRKEF
jgi:hypothetical protein